jgi:3'-phosphoadenosine 5'-phosphosulfate (PAPS) 3'-phosphatase
LIGTLSKHTLGLAVGLDIAFAVWSALKNEYAEDSQERNSPSDNKSPIFAKKITEPLENTFESSKDYVMTLQLLGNQFQTKKKSFASSQVSALNMKPLLPQC